MEPDPIALRKAFTVAGAAGFQEDLGTWQRPPSLRTRPRCGSDSTESGLSEVESCRSFSDAPVHAAPSSSSQSSSACSDVDMAKPDRPVGKPNRHVFQAFAEAGESEHMLELMICPGDLLFVQDDLALACNTRILVVVAVPLLLPRRSYASQKFAAMMPSGDCSELWLICVLEWSKERQGLHKARKVFYVDNATRRLVLLGEADEGGAEHALVELWQSPAWLRVNLRTDLIRQALDNITVAMNAGADGSDEALKPFRKAWQREASASCVGVVLVFWQLYLIALAVSTSSTETSHGMLTKWMPVMADSTGVEELRTTLQLTGWVSLHQIPILKRPSIGILQPDRAPYSTLYRDNFEREVADTWTKNDSKLWPNLLESLDADAQEVFDNPPSDGDDSLADLTRTRGRLFRRSIIGI